MMKLKQIILPTAINVDFGLLLFRITVGLTMSFYGYYKMQNYTEIVNEDFWQTKVSLFGLTGAIPLSLTIFAELFCSVLLILGLFTRIALFFLLFCMGYIAFYLDAFELISASEHGLDMNSAFKYFLMYTTLFFTGAGKYSIDELINKKSK